MMENRELPPETTGLPGDNNEESVTQEIKDLFAQGYTAEEIIKEHGYARTTTNMVAKKLNLPHKNKTEVSKIPIKLSGREIIPPEVALRNIKLQDGDYKEGYIDGMAVLIMASRYNQLLAASQAEVMREQLEIFKAAQGGTDQVIREVANMFAGATEQDKQEILSAIQKQTIASSPNPMQTMLQQTMASTFGPMLTDTMSRLMGQFTKSQPGAPQPGGSQQQQPPQQQGQPPPQDQAPQQPGQVPGQGQSQWANVRERPISEWESETSRDKNPMVEHHKLDELEHRPINEFDKD